MKPPLYKRSALLAFALLLLGVGLPCFVWVRAQQRQYTINRQLIAALKKKDTKQALELVNAGADPNTRFEPTSAPSLPELMNQLLHRSQVTVNNRYATTHRSPTAFMLACGTLWSVGATNYVVNAIDLLLVQAMLRHGADVNAKEIWGYVPLQGAISWQNKPCIKLLLDNGAGVNTKDEDGNSLVCWAVNTQNIEIVKILLDYGADPVSINTEKDTPLSLAKDHHRPDIIALLHKYSKHP